MSEQLDPDRVQELAAKILVPVNENYLQGPRSRMRVYETLNALAVVTAITIAGSGHPHDPDAFGFFVEALNQQIRGLCPPGKPQNN